MLPKIVHSIWLGNKEFPEEAQCYLSSWTKFNKGFELVLWDDKKAEDLIKWSIFSNIYKNSNWVGMKSDILRYEILHKIGGVYVDVDFECLRPIKDILKGTEFVYGDQHTHEPAIGFLSSYPQSSFLTYFLPLLKANIENGKHSQNIFEGTLERTGPFFFQNCLKSWYGFDKNCERILDKDGRHIGDKRKDVLALFEWAIYPYNPYKGKPQFNRDEHPDAYAAHHWWKSWI